MSQESSSAPTTVIPIAIEQSYLEGRGLTRVDPSEFDGENITRDEDYTSESYKHDFYAGKHVVVIKYMISYYITEQLHLAYYMATYYMRHI